MSENKLLPCPFCGGKPCIKNEDYIDEQKTIPCMYVECIECKCRSPLVAIQHTEPKDFQKTYELLKKVWNVRKPMERIVERVEEARQKYQRLQKEQGEKEDEAINILFRGMMKIVKEEGASE